MRPHIRAPTQLRGVALAVMGALGGVAGCSLIGSHPVAAPKAVAAAPPAPAVAALPAPLDTHKFTLAADDDVVGAVQIVLAGKDDTLPDIARRFNVGYEEIVGANPGVDPWIPGAGHPIVVPTEFVLPNAPHEGIVINVAAMRLFYFAPHKKGEPQLVYTHPIGVGKAGWSTPEGVTHVTGRKQDPIWRPSLDLRRDHFKDNGEAYAAVVGPGPDNPLGKYELTLGWPSYLIHGTNKPYGIGLRSSHGCVRLYPEDIVKLYAMVPNGTPVRVVDQPFLLGWHNGALYIQAYAVLEDDKRDWKHHEQPLLSSAIPARVKQDLRTLHEPIDWASVAAVTQAPRRVPVPVTGAGKGTVDAVLASAAQVQNRIPDGANWDGTDDTGTDGKSAQQLLNEREPSAASAAAAPSAHPAVAEGARAAVD